LAEDITMTDQSFSVCFFTGALTGVAGFASACGASSVADCAGQAQGRSAARSRNNDETANLRNRARDKFVIPRAGRATLLCIRDASISLNSYKNAPCRGKIERWRLSLFKQQLCPSSNKYVPEMDRTRTALPAVKLAATFGPTSETVEAFGETLSTAWHIAWTQARNPPG
jgi:hypothetical protein